MTGKQLTNEHLVQILRTLQPYSALILHDLAPYFIIYIKE